MMEVIASLAIADLQHCDDYKHVSQWLKINTKLRH